MAQPRSATPPERTTAQELEEEVRVLERRLREGEEMVRRGKESGGSRELLDRWEVAWIKLLHQYERLYDRLQRQTGAKRAEFGGSL
jgi:hypothetical protein